MQITMNLAKQVIPKEDNLLHDLFDLSYNKSLSDEEILHFHATYINIFFWQTWHIYIKNNNWKTLFGISNNATKRSNLPHLHP